MDETEVRKEDNYRYYAYCLLYVDDILIVHHDGLKAFREIDYFFKTKAGSMRDPTLQNGVVAWA